MTSLTTFSQSYEEDSVRIRMMSDLILEEYDCYKDLRDLCKNIGHRISGSPQAEQAVQWSKKVLEDIGCDRVYLQETMVPHWVRGEEDAWYYVEGQRIKVPITSLGNAAGTGKRGLRAPMIMVNNMDEFQALKNEDVKGKIVFFNYRFNQKNINTFSSYGPCVYYRWASPVEVVKKGGIGVVIRSVSSAFDDKPHTGTTHYEDDLVKLPAVAVSNVHADIIEKEFLAKKKVNFEIRTTCEMLPDVKSHNVIGEMRGSEFPDEIITFGGHLDSWDIGEGAHDDGAGVVTCMDVMRTFKKLNIKPKRTIRCVLFMNEENGLRGAKTYAAEAVRLKENHILGIETDAGGATPYGFGITMSPEQKRKVRSWAPLFRPYNIYNFDNEGGGADLSPLKKEFKTPTMGLRPDGHRYFDMHHSANDVFENVHRRELCMGSIAMSMMVYLVSEYGLDADEF